VTNEITLPVTYLGEAKDPWATPGRIRERDHGQSEGLGLVWNAALETGGFLVGDEVKISVSVQAVAQ